MTPGHGFLGISGSGVDVNTDHLSEVVIQFVVGDINIAVDGFPVGAIV